MKRVLLIMLTFIGYLMNVNAQIGYQVTVYDQTKNAPKANQTVTATVTITDNSGGQIVSQTYTGSTDEFGILSMTVGNANSFANADWDKLPFWVSATVDGVTISKTQMLSVPVAEYAKQTGQLTKDILCGKIWKHHYGYDYGGVDNNSISFNKDGTGILKKVYTDAGGGTYTTTTTFKYYISGDTVFCRDPNGKRGFALFYNPKTKELLLDDAQIYY